MTEIDANKGLEFKPVEGGDEDDLDIPVPDEDIDNEGENKDDGKEKGDEQKEPIDQDELKVLRKSFLLITQKYCSMLF